MSLTLNTGNIYRHNYGTTSPPNTNLFGWFPSLEYDTFVCMGDLTSVPSTDLNHPNSFSSKEIKDFVWFKTGLFTEYGVQQRPGQDLTTFTNLADCAIAQITLSSDSEGCYVLDYASTVRFEGFIINGCMHTPNDIKSLEL